jgi:hypothetical protein
MVARKGTTKIMDFSDDLVNLFESDADGLFTAPQKAKPITPDDRLTASFRQITEFVETNDRLPDINATDISEASLAARLNSIKANKDKVEALEPVDSLGLLEVPEAPESIDELFTEDTFGLFEGVGDDILKMKHVPSTGIKASPEYVAKRKPAADFASFKDGFAEQQSKLKDGFSKLVRFTNVTSLQPKRYFVSGGLMCYIDAVGEAKIVHGRAKERIRVIFENGTESNMFLRSLASQLYDDGYVVVDKEYTGEIQLEDSDSVAGYIYVLSSKSSDEKITSVKDLHKIGFSTTTITERIKDAEKDPTYLMSGVEVVDSYVLTGDYNPQKVEHFIHRIFADVKVDLKIIDKDGREYTPSEWYSVPLLAIEQAVNMLQNGDVVEYHYDKNLGSFVQNGDIENA